jgi:ABC-type multidrug transport system fused ATPase/permease subunit
MPPDTYTSTRADQPLLPTLRRFLPFLWPAGQPKLKARIVVAMLLVIASKLIQVFGAAFTLKYAVDRMAGNDRGALTLVVLLVVGYAASRFGTTLFDNLRNAVFERVGQDASRRLAAQVFRHLHALSLDFHLSRRTGAVTKVVERGTKSIDTMLYFLLFNIAPTVFELVLVLGLFWTKFGWPLVVATVVMVVGYILFTRMVTDWRNALRARMNDLDTGAVAHAVDSLLNFETVKYFGAEEREARRYDQAITAYSEAAVKSENSLAWLNLGQALITNLMLAGGMGFVVWRWSRGEASAGDVVFVSTLLAQLFRPLDLLGMVYRTIRQGALDMAAMFDLIDTPASVVDAPDAPALAVSAGHVRFEGVSFGYDAGRPILSDLELDVPAGSTLAVVGPSGVAVPVLRPDGRADHRRWAGYFRGRAGFVARCDRDRAAGYGAVQRHDRVQYRLRARGGRDARGRDGGEGGGDLGVHRAPAFGVCDARGRAWVEAVGRRETARGNRADSVEEPAGPDSG